MSGHISMAGSCTFVKGARLWLLTINGIFHS